MAAQFNGRVALVTGAGAGIGRASARAFAAAGAAVAVVDVDVGLGEETVALIRQAGDAEARGAEARFFRCDVSDEQQVSALVRAVTDMFGRLDYAHNNAGISPVTGNTVNCPKELWDAIIGVNLTGVWLGMKYEIPAMIAAGGGAIVNTSSGVGLKAFPNQPAYVASKHGVVGLTKTAALEFATAGIRVNAICPGATLTPMVETKARAGAYTLDAMAAMCPMKRMADADEIAQVAVWLCSAAASFVNGAILPVDGGILAG
jgi:NAD(P)-dependent dehydrogenase (short-subunit alcohol dehydrogenase family)